MNRDFVKNAIATMDHAERDTAYRSAIEDGDVRRADEIAFAAIPNEWPERDRAVWLARRTIARNREAGST
jgi:hypothetical protein